MTLPDSGKALLVKLCVRRCQTVSFVCAEGGGVDGSVRVPARSSGLLLYLTALGILHG